MESYVICHHCKKLRKEADAPLASYTDPLLGHGIHNICRWCTEAALPTPVSAGEVPVARPLSAEDMGPSWAGAATESSLEQPSIGPIAFPDWRVWVERRIWEIETAMKAPESSRPPPSAGQQSPPSGQRITAEGPPGVTISITTEAGLVAVCTWTPTGITCTTRGTLLLPRQDQILPGPVEFA